MYPLGCLVLTAKGHETLKLKLKLSWWQGRNVKGITTHIITLTKPIAQLIILNRKELI